LTISEKSKTRKINLEKFGAKDEELVKVEKKGSKKDDVGEERGGI